MSVAKAYAKALYEAAAEGKSQTDFTKVCDEIEDQLNQFRSLIENSHDAKVVLVSPLTTTKDKEQIVQALTRKMELSTIVSRFLALMASKGRLGLLSEVTDFFSDVRLAAEGGVSGKLVSAEPISKDDIDSLALAFQRKLGKKISFRTSVDPTLLAGVRVTVNGVTYDGTLRAQLDQLRNRLVTTAATA